MKYNAQSLQKMLKGPWTILMAVAAAFAVSVLFILALGENPFAVYASILSGVFGHPYGLMEVFAKATPLIIIGVGVAVAGKGGMTNLGGDGQFYIGAISSIVIGIYCFDKMPPVLIWILAVAAAVAGGGIWGGIAGWLRARFNTSEVIITIMMNYVALYLVAFLVGGPLQAPGGIPQTYALDKTLWFSKLFESGRVHTGIVVALFIAVIVWLVFKKTALGYKIETFGHSRFAAAYGGIDTKRYMLLTMLISGGIAGLAGMVEVFGTYYRVLEGITTDLGFIAMLIALLARYNPIAVIAGSLFIAVLTVGANSMQIDMNVPTAIMGIVQSLIIFFVIVMPGIQKKIGRSLVQKRQSERG